MKLLYSEKLKNKTTTRNIPVKCSKCSNFVMKLYCLQLEVLVPFHVADITRGERQSD